MLRRERMLIGNDSSNVIIGIIQPFTIISRDENDKFDFDIEAVNSGKYNNIKLARITKFKEMKEYLLGISFSGCLIIPKDHQFIDVENLLEEYNKILASLLMGGIFVKSIRLRDIAFGELTEEGYFRYIHTFGNLSQTYRSLAESEASTAQRMNLFKSRYLEYEDFNNAYEYGNKIIEKFVNLSPLIFLNSFTDFVEMNYNESLTNSWISIEQILELIWKEYFIENNKSEIPKRNKFLISQQWNIAHKTEMLFQMKIFDDDVYKHLSLARIARNDFIHKGTTPKKENVKNSIAALIDLIETFTKLKGIQFNRKKLDSLLKEKNEEKIENREQLIKKLEEGQQIFYKKRKAIPGNEDWDGDYEDIEDIKIEFY